MPAIKGISTASDDVPSGKSKGPREGGELPVLLKELERISLQLSVPQIFAGDTIAFQDSVPGSKLTALSACYDEVDEQSERPEGAHPKAKEEVKLTRAAQTWASHILPGLLQQAQASIDRLASFSSSNLEEEDEVRVEKVLAKIIPALAKYVTPRAIPYPVDDTPETPRPDAKGPPEMIDTFSGTHRNHSAAESSLSSACKAFDGLVQPQGKQSKKVSLAASSSDHITFSPLVNLSIKTLREYIKPLFRQSSTNRVKQETGRAAPVNPNLTEAAGAFSPASTSAWDEIPWKGGNIRNRLGASIGKDADSLDELSHLMNEVKLEGSTTKSGLGYHEASILLAGRHAGLGSINVFAWAVQTVAQAKCSQSSQDRETYRQQQELWNEAWPLIIPPLLTLLDDTSITSRTLGARILHLAFFSRPEAKLDNMEPSKEALVPMLQLLRSGLLPLFESSLHASMMFLSDPFAYACLRDTYLAARQLAIMATSASVQRALRGTSVSAGDNQERYQDSRGKSIQQQRFEKLCFLIDQGGILRGWVYIPLPTLSSQREERSSKLSNLNFDNGKIVPLDEEDTTQSDSLPGFHTSIHSGVASMLVLLRVAQQLFRDVGPPGCARYLDQALEFLCALLSSRKSQEGVAAAAACYQQIILATECVATIYTLVDQCTKDSLGVKHGKKPGQPVEGDPDGDSEDAIPFPLYPPNFLDRAEEVLFAVSTCWVNLHLYTDGGADPEAKGLRARLNELVSKLVQAVPALQHDVIPELKGLDQRMVGLFLNVSS